MDVDAFRELLTPDGQEALRRAAAGLAAGEEGLRIVSGLRRSFGPGLSGAALAQATLRARGAAKFGADAAVMYFTGDGLEQATRAEVAAHRARRFAEGAAEVTTVADVCCGIGGDMIALARAGRRVEAVDADPLTAEVARANAAVLGLAGLVTVRVGEASQVEPEGYDALFADPARRSTGRRVFDPMAYSPPWPRVLALAERARAACLKVAPGLPYELIPEDAEAEWVSYRGEVKEAVLWTGAFAARPGRRATMLPSGDTLTADPSLGPAPHGPVARYLYEPDGAAVRAHLVAEVAALVGGHLIDPHIAYITAESPASTPWAARYEVLEALPFSLKRLRAALRERGIGTVTLKKRGSALDLERLRKDLRLSGDKSCVVVLTRIGTDPFAFICRPS
ncbi:methyltransferase [Sphaerisporangium krabiense]|uniref:SAM-dependent methyltransferase n=1 Tax=Sphaerisporangium krabiense TaxID=763782 RepID=A0A7W9DND7_9ACTN|nr:class I SAM-dependent methyltransferase [Sphaerisporangium krabiense]MBB5624879.1 SAM-dependent methyltransferase [Sphaerisporangium krabiense]GII66419.1 methyltransferase [Sphaerisporangium krabiense]